MIQLVVKHPFGTYQVGDHITDQAEVAKWRASHPAHVIPKLYDPPQDADPAPDASSASAEQPQG